MSNVPIKRIRPGTPPCYQCEDRHMHCHASCPRYAKYKEDRQIEYKKMYETYSKEHDVESFVIKQMIKQKKRRNGR